MAKPSKYQTSYGKALEGKKDKSSSSFLKEQDDIGELISQIRLRGLKPSQVFKADEIKEDPDFKKMIQGEVDYELWLRDQKAEEELNQEMDKETEEAKLKEKENELLPGSPEKLTEEEKQRRKEIADNELIPDDDYKGEKGDNELIPD